MKLRPYVYDIDTSQQCLLKVFVQQLNSYCATISNGTWTTTGNEIKFGNSICSKEDFFQSCSNPKHVKTEYLLVFLSYTEAVDKAKAEGNAFHEREIARIEAPGQKKRKLMDEQRLNACIRIPNRIALSKEQMILLSKLAQKQQYGLMLTGQLATAPPPLSSSSTDLTLNPCLIECMSSEFAVLHGLIMAHVTAKKERKRKLQEKKRKLKERLLEVKRRKKMLQVQILHQKKLYQRQKDAGKAYLKHCLNPHRPPIDDI